MQFSTGDWPVNMQAVSAVQEVISGISSLLVLILIFDFLCLLIVVNIEVYCYSILFLLLTTCRIIPLTIDFTYV